MNVNETVHILSSTGKLIGINQVGEKTLATVNINGTTVCNIPIELVIPAELPRKGCED